MSKSKYINTFNTTAEYDAYIESAYPEFPNVGYDKQTGKVNIRRTSPNNYQIWGTTTATSNFNIKLNNTNVEVTVDPDLGEFYLTGWTGTLTSIKQCFQNNTNITSIKKFALDTSHITGDGCTTICYGCSNLTFLDTSFILNNTITNIAQNFNGCGSLTSLDLSSWDTKNVTTIMNIFNNCRSLTSLNLNGCDFSNVTTQSSAFTNCSSLTDVYITVEATLMKLTNNLTSQGGNYIPSTATIHYNGIDYTWQSNAWTPQS